MVRDRQTGHPVPTSISRATGDDLRSLGAGWNFEWAGEARRSEVHKLIDDGAPGAILGLIALGDREGYVEVVLLECSPLNVGRGKRIEGIAGILLAFAAGLSSDAGHEGYLALDSKTQLIEHYCTTYGFRRIGLSHRLILGRDAATRLVRAHLGKEI